MENKTKHFAQLATDSDYLRSIAASTKPEHIVMDLNLAVLNDVLAAFNLSDLYSLVTKDTIDADKVQVIIDQFFAQIITNGVTEEQKKKLLNMWHYLAEDDGGEVEAADMIFVFGGPEDTKAKRAAELYLAGKAPQIIFTGDTQRALRDLPHESESVRDQKIAIAAGVPESATIVERTSFNTPGNVENAIEILRSVEPFPTSFILINLPWYLRRATNTFITYWRNAPKPYTRIQRVNAGSSQYAAENYFLHRRGLEYVVFEYLKIKQARDMGHM